MDEEYVSPGDTLEGNPADGELPRGVGEVRPRYCPKPYPLSSGTTKLALLATGDEGGDILGNRSAAEAGEVTLLLVPVESPADLSPAAATFTLRPAGLFPTTGGAGPCLPPPALMAS